MSVQAISREHYERAVEDFLQAKSVPYLRVDQIKRSAFAGVKLKSFDLVVANDAREPGAGFEVETNRVVLVGTDGEGVSPEPRVAQHPPHDDG